MKLEVFCQQFGSVEKKQRMIEMLALSLLMICGRYEGYVRLS